MLTNITARAFRSINFLVIVLLFFCMKISAQPGSWIEQRSLPGAARANAVGFSIGSKGYVGTGSAYGPTGPVSYKDFWEYDPVGNTWSQKADFGGTARTDAVGFSIGSKGYLGTGNDGSPEKDFWEYDPSANIWTRKADFGGTARSSAVGLSVGTK